MRKVFKEDFVLHTSGINIGRINWINNVGKNIRFKYDDIEGIITIKQYNNPNVTISYNDYTTTIHVNQVRKCQLGGFLNIFSKNYLYKIGDEINNNIILKQIRVKQGNETSKGYKYKCLKDGYIGETTEVNMKTINCPICTNNKVFEGINDITTTHPHLVKYFTDEKNAKKYTYGSGKSTKFRCTDCGYIKEMKITTLSKYGFSCPMCGDGISYPNKFVFNILMQLNIIFEIEKGFSWSKNRKYDFYIPSYGIIIEAMGNQHYEKSFDFKNGRTTSEEYENDLLKQRLASENGIKEYININCSKSEKEWIRQSVLDSNLINYFDLSKVKWNECETFALSNRVKEACVLLNEGFTPPEISKIMKLSTSTIWVYLNKGSELDWCHYNNKWFVEEFAERTKRIRSKKVEMFKNNISLGIFESSSELSRQSEKLFGAKLNQSKISNVCNGKRNHYKGYTFKFV